MQAEERTKALDLLFKPRNVVIYPAIPKIGFFVTGFQTQGFDLEKLFLINNTEEKLFGIKCYKSIEDIPSETVDLLILAVRRELLMESLEYILSKRKIHFFHIFTAGTGEFDEIGLKIEQEVKEFFDNHPETKAVGPNCMGLYCPSGHNSYMPRFPNIPGNIGLIYHSGDLHSRVITNGYSRYGLTFSKGVSAGNCINLQVTDFLEYYEQDEETEIISIYFEGFSKYHKNEGRKLLNLVKGMKKPVLFLRGGITRRGQTAVLSHTGSLGTSDRIWDAVYKQTPLIEVESSMNENIDYLYMFNVFFKKYGDLKFEEKLNLFPKTNNALVILYSGGLGILDTDMLTQVGLNLPIFDNEAIERLRKVYPIKIGSLSNPLDIPWASRSEKYLNLCKTAIKENVDVIIMHTNARSIVDKERFEKYYGNLKQIREEAEALNKILIMILDESPQKIRNDYFQLLVQENFIVFSDLRKAARAFLAFYEYGKKIRHIHQKEL